MRILRFLPGGAHGLELTAILRQSPARISRHLRLLMQAGLVDRFREGAWAFFRLAERGGAGEALPASSWRASMSTDDRIARDRERLAAVRAQRAASAQSYFRRHAAVGYIHQSARRRGGGRGGPSMPRWASTDARAARPRRTAPERMLELFGPSSTADWGSISPWTCWRSRVRRSTARDYAPLQRPAGDIYDLALANDAFDAVIIHQVLHFLDDGARAIREAARVLRPAGSLLVVDFAPHQLEFLRDEHAHRRLGFAEETVSEWMRAAGLQVALHRKLAPPEASGRIAVSLWLGRDQRVTLAQPVMSQVA